jgi:type II secretion system protein G
MGRWDLQPIRLNVRRIRVVRRRRTREQRGPARFAALSIHRLPMKWKMSNTVICAAGLLCAGMAVSFVQIGGWNGLGDDPIESINRACNGLWKRMTSRPTGTPVRAVIDTANLVPLVHRFDSLNHRLPANSEGLKALVLRPRNSDLPNLQPLMLDLPTDPWGRPYQYPTPSTRGKRAFDIYSLGRDGIVSGDDIGTW